MVMAKIKHWMEKFLEEPLYRAELRRAEALLEDENLMESLVLSLSNNYCTIKSWSR